eukprot:CAMPEP_0172512628 /NCGR_PEP_ID=MMETSP1066-20121228/246054_1 /TAXON_ID=671091 /ORGANISM="Coscinodiscus wailesii, Strain CCMP2513" /LENGTH=381 /DNA_ID=CAMNT_0013292537 /DNA_START=204 /DNA_END=1349 /DNA_ORIENTATION=+
MAPVQYSRRRSNLDDDYLYENRALDIPNNYVKYEMVELPDSMIETTIFVGNLCEFVTDDMLSELFQGVSGLYSIPSVVARKPNTSSLKYGFATFPTVQEKEAAIAKFNGHVLNSRKLKVESIRRTIPRVRVPGKLVTYTLGPAKKIPSFDKQRHSKSSIKSLRRISYDYDEKYLRPSPKTGKMKKKRRVPQHRLSDAEQQELERSAKKGYITLDGTAWRQGRKGSPLANSHRLWCDERSKPQIILCRASGGRMYDNVIVDLSPLRLSALYDTPQIDEVLTSWKLDVFEAAEVNGMQLNDEYHEDNTWDGNRSCDVNDWAVKPIWRLPVVSVGVFEGHRAQAKEMAKYLVALWAVIDHHSPPHNIKRGTHKNKNLHDLRRKH